MRSPIGVTIANSDLLVRTGLETLLRGAEGIVVVDLCVTFAEMLDSVATRPPDLLLTDLGMPESRADEAIRATQQLRRSDPELGVVVLAQSFDPMVAMAILEHGASRRGCLLRRSVTNTERLLQAIQTVASGGSFIDTEVLDALVTARAFRAVRNGLETLTTREAAVLAEMAAGRSNSAIGETLHIGERAVEKHISAIFLKLGPGNDHEVHRRVVAVLRYLAVLGPDTIPPATFAVEPLAATPG